MEKTDPNYCPNCGIHRFHASPGCEGHGQPNPLADANDDQELTEQPQGYPVGHEPLANFSGRIDGKPDIIGADGFVHGEPLNLTDEERAKLPPIGDAKDGEPNVLGTHGSANDTRSSFDDKF